MTFLEPVRLVLLLVPVALVAAFWVAGRRRRATATRFAGTDLLASVAPRTSGWQRWVAWSLLTVAMAAGVLGFAEPAAEIQVPKERATIMLTLDTSKSMEAQDVAPSRLAAAQAAARSFVAGLPPGLQVGLVTYDGTARLEQAPSPDRAALNRAIDGIDLGAGTNTGEGLALALNAIENVPPDADGRRPPAAVVLMSDGTPTVGTADLTPEAAVAAQAERAKEAGIPITTIAFGTEDGVVVIDGERIPVPVDPEALAGVSEASGGQTFTAESASELGSVYDAIGSAVGYDTETRDISAWFAGAAFLLAALAGVAALRWSSALT